MKSVDSNVPSKNAPDCAGYTNDLALGQMQDQEVFEDCAEEFVNEEPCTSLQQETVAEMGLDNIFVEFPKVISTLDNERPTYCSSETAEKGKYEIAIKHDNSHTLTSAGSVSPSCEEMSELNAASVEAEPSRIAIKHDNSHILASAGSDVSPSCEEMSELNAASVEKEPSRKRSRPCSSPLSDLSNKGEFSQSSESRSTQLTSSFPKVYHCRYPGCVGKRVVYNNGKKDLICHARTHWGRKMRKCRLCDYVTTTDDRLRAHHKKNHPEQKYAGAVSLETEKDMEELLNLWKQCFPEYATLRAKK